MAKLNTAQIKSVAKQKVAAVPEGVRWTTLVNEIKAEFPETPINTIWGCTNLLFKDDPEIVKISKGIYALSGKNAIWKQPRLPRMRQAWRGSRVIAPRHSSCSSCCCWPSPK